jgi:cold shock CspA family protein
MGGWQIMIGIITRTHERGYGFLVPDGSKHSYFFNAVDCFTPFNKLTAGNRVVFDEGIRSDKGPRATNLQLESEFIEEETA